MKRATERIRPKVCRSSARPGRGKRAGAAFLCGRLTGRQKPLSSRRKPDYNRPYPE
jgi:hypothetical protein